MIAALSEFSLLFCAAQLSKMATMAREKSIQGIWREYFSGKTDELFGR